MLLTARTLQAVNALQALKEGKKTCNQIAAEIMADAPYLSQILHRLVESGLVSACPGPGGGYSLNAGAVDVELLDLMRIMGQSIVEPVGGRASDNLTRLLHDACNVRLEKLL